MSLSKHLVNSVKNVFISDRLASLCILIVQINSTIFYFPTAFSHTTIAHNVHTVNAVNFATNFCCTFPFCLQQNNDDAQLTLGWRIHHSSCFKGSLSQLQLMCWTRQWQMLWWIILKNLVLFMMVIPHFLENITLVF